MTDKQNHFTYTDNTSDNNDKIMENLHKQIIINGVDVSGCAERSMCINCETVTNCYYKQLKRTEAQCEDMFVKHTDLEIKYRQKEQECEELKKRISNYKCPMDYSTDYCGHLEDYGKLLGQLNQLKAELQQYKKSKQASYEALQEELNDLKLKSRKLEKDYKEVKLCYKNNLQRLREEETNLTKLANKYLRLEQTLTEIKEIAKRDNEFCIKCNGDKEIDCIECIEGGRALLAKEILQKISEVIENE